MGSGTVGIGALPSTLMEATSLVVRTTTIDTGGGADPLHCSANTGRPCVASTGHDQPLDPSKA